MDVWLRNAISIQRTILLGKCEGCRKVLVGWDASEVTTINSYELVPHCHFRQMRLRTPPQHPEGASNHQDLKAQA